ncbi:uncharacterized protein LACBIDRAFT_314162 [Laccaria bicolor S238N-H82]|uniref:Predicted protein n=1 Tax=Laccaria bicolor (strain S238N-H82 / ATCC MYA-4686) TaxID=486041 RepID=B0D1Q7_LACBS|nr:uncharacterized protein LACBIDRAFT_314162 [Laccaria bicolor S238N-H82]EDR12036.1 predicted protein [Laccaria bicolor S238N-H82]|eukprot:XP_001877933.1 predicted protein [Laccaria bicolor S238N-H82]
MLETVKKDFTYDRRGSEPSTSTLSSSLSSRFSASVRLPYRRRRGGVVDDNHPGHEKLSLLSLSLSSPSFLESVVKDNRSDKPVYTIQTSECTTSVIRTDAHNASVNVACIKWPKTLPTRVKGKEATSGVLLQMKGTWWNDGDNFLRPPTQLSSGRKFNIPNYSHHMQWKRRRNGSYWCTTPSVKGPIATLDAASPSSPPKITIFETLHDKHDSRSVHIHQGVSIVLLDYIITSALLLVTDVQEWMVVRKYDEELPTDKDNGRAGLETGLSDSQWRKVMFGVPLYPTLTDDAEVPPTPVSKDNHSHLRSELSLSDEDDDDSEGPTRPPSPSAESMYSPLSDPSAPSHTYIDPLFYSKNRPPIPTIPLQHTQSFHNARHVPTSRPSTPSSPSSSRLLPLSTGQSTYTSPSLFPNKGAIQHTNEDPASATTQTLPAEASPLYPHAPSQTTTTIGARPLPRPPRRAANPDTIDENDVDIRAMTLKRAQSHADMLSPAIAVHRTTTTTRTQRSLPPTPGSLSPSPLSPSTPSTQTHLTPAPHTPITQDSHRQRPPLTKGSAEDLTRWVHLLTSSNARDLPPEPLPQTAVFDVPPPAYDSIAFDRRRSAGGG